jgi:hypothetical protein
MKNRELFLKDPVQSELLNNGVAEVRDIQSQGELQTLRYELETFVCEGQYATGLARILSPFCSSGTYHCDVVVIRTAGACSAGADR